MTIEVFSCKQNSPDWYAVRAGIPTASEFATILTKGRGGNPSKVRHTYMLKLAGEILTGEPMDNFSNHHMERGKALEPEARNLYAMIHDCEPEQVGFIRNGSKGCSPDSLIGEKGMVEIKTKLPHLMIDVLLHEELPKEHKAQCQGQLWVAEREWVDFVCYWPSLPLFIKREHRDEEYIKTLSEEIDRFNNDLSALVERIRAYGQKDAA